MLRNLQEYWSVFNGGVMCPVDSKKGVLDVGWFG